jgi:hypothetical protein
MSRDAIRVQLAIRALLALSFAAFACGAEPEESAPGDASGEPAAIGGHWAVEGETVETGREEHKRRISGTVILAQQGGHYTSTFTMSTMFPTPEGASLETDVIGKGEGTIQGSQIRGEARTQLVVASVPGVDPDFAFVPRTTSTRIVSTVEGALQPDGTIVLHIQSKGEPGQDYRPTRTTLRGKRTSARAAPEPPEE